MLDLANLGAEETLLVAHIEDFARHIAGRGGCRFSAFLDERGQLIAEETLRRAGVLDFLFYGGYPDALRRMLGVFPDWQPPKPDVFPLNAVVIHLPKGADLSHRDVLGSLMSLGIRRESLGDILLTERCCDVFVQESIAPLLADELTKIGGVGVRCEIGFRENYVREESFDDIRTTLQSPRMDALVSALTGSSREKGAGLIRAGLVFRNHRTVHSVSEAFAPGDTLSIRGYGKYKVDEIGNPTKKGRLPVLCRKYR